MRLTLALLLFITASQAQWQIQQSNTTADLRGIHSLGNGVAWASGSKGTVLRTIDNGTTWQTCMVPPGAQTLDFRGIQAFDAQSAIIMSSGKGDLSRLYKTTDGCKSWNQVFSDIYGPEGFFDALLFIDPNHGILLGDPTGSGVGHPTEYEGNFRMRVTADGGHVWGPISAPDMGKPGTGLHALPAEAAFAASNSAMAQSGGLLWFATSSARVSSRRLWHGTEPNVFSFQSTFCAGAVDPVSGECGQPWTDFTDSQLPISHAGPSEGIFALAFRNTKAGVAVGGDYLKPKESSAVSAWTSDGGSHWNAPALQPQGYRSSVAFDTSANIWITVGPNGTDLSTDDGRNWHPLNPTAEESQHWNALSLPFVVGPHGRIGLLRPDALKP